MLIQILTFIINYYHDGSLEMNLNFALKKINLLMMYIRYLLLI